MSVNVFFIIFVYHAPSQSAFFRVIKETNSGDGRHLQNENNTLFLKIVV